MLFSSCTWPVKCSFDSLARLAGVINCLSNKERKFIIYLLPVFLSSPNNANIVCRKCDHKGTNLIIVGGLLLKSHYYSFLFHPLPPPPHTHLPDIILCNPLTECCPYTTLYIQCGCNLISWNRQIQNDLYFPSLFLKINICKFSIAFRLFYKIFRLCPS